MSGAGDSGVERAELEALRAENLALRRQLGRTSSPALGDSELLSSLLRALPAYVVWLNKDLLVRFANRVPPSLDLQSTLGRSSLELVAEGDRGAFELACRRVVERGETERLSLRAAADGTSLRDYELIMTPLHADGEPGVLALAFDVTERAEKSRELARSREQLRLAVNATGVGFWDWDLVAQEAHWDDRSREIMGMREPYDCDEFVERAVHPEDREYVQRVMQEARGGASNPSLTYRIVRPDGSVRWILQSGTVEHDASGEALRLLGGFLDITQTRDLEERLEQFQKMEALGTLTAGVAHNFNNLLAVILPSLELLAPHVEGDGVGALEDARAAASQAAAVVRQLMAFTGQQESARDRTQNLGQLVAESIRLSRRAIGESIELEVGELPADALVKCDGAELQQVLTNLIGNAVDSLRRGVSQGGPPRIEVSLDHVEKLPKPGSGEHRLGGYYRIQIDDNGGGVPEALRQRIFEPFFTTKAPSGGTGLGLAMAWAVMRGLGGSINVDERPGGGARFSVFIPCLLGAAGEVAVLTMPPPRERVRRILLVEDADAVRRVTGLILRSAQHEVSEAVTAADALSHAARDAFDLILLDQSLPDRRGIAIVDTLRQLQPRARILLFTGERVSQQDMAKVDGVIAKPMSVKQLLAEIG